MKSGTWRPAINISNPPEGFKPNHVTVLNRTDEAEGRPFQLSDKKAVMAPHGDLSETDAYVTVDDMTGYVYLTYKEDHREVVTDDWELRVVVALLDPSTYDILWTEQVTSGYLGLHFLPTVSAFNDKAMMAFAWYQEGTYNYIAFERKGNTLVYDSHVLEDHPIAAIPVAPHWELQSDFGDRAMVDGFRDRMQARLQLVPPHDPQFRRNRERVIRDAERENVELDWDLGVPED